MWLTLWYRGRCIFKQTNSGFIFEFYNSGGFSYNITGEQQNEFKGVHKHEYIINMLRYKNVFTSNVTTLSRIKTYFHIICAKGFNLSFKIWHAIDTDILHVTQLRVYLPFVWPINWTCILLAPSLDLVTHLAYNLTCSFHVRTCLLGDNWSTATTLTRACLWYECFQFAFHLAKLALANLKATGTQC